MAAERGTTLFLWLSILEPLSLAWTQPDAGVVGNSISAVTHQMSLTQWASLILSRGIYTILAFLIILYVVYTVLRNKLGRPRAVGEYDLSSESSKWLDALWKTTGCNKITNCSNVALRRYSLSNLVGGHGVEGDQDLDLEEKLRTFETEVSALRGELEISHKSRLELESSLELLDRDKMSTEEKLASERVSGLMELEQLREENKNTQRELQRVLSEKADLGREVESLQREARIAEAALRDQISLQGRLEEARAEVEALKQQMSSLKQEKEVAVSLVGDIMAKATRRSPSLPLAAPLPDSLSHFEDSDLLMMVGDAVGETLSPGIEDLEEPGEVEETFQEDRSSDSEMNDGWLRRRQGISDSDSDEVMSPLVGGGDENRPLTSSSLFRNFLQKNFV